jgi:hypothetical protein
MFMSPQKCSTYVFTIDRGNGLGQFLSFHPIDAHGLSSQSPAFGMTHSDTFSLSTVPLPRSKGSVNDWLIEWDMLKPLPKS